MRGIVAARFQDRLTMAVMEVGQAYEGTAERIAELARRGFVTPAGDGAEPEPVVAEPEPTPAAPEPERELGEMTNPELAGLLRSLGVEPPKKANKATLVRLVREARGE